MSNKAEKIEEEAANGDFTTIGITFEARDKLKRLCEKRNGANVRDVSSALVNWFVKQKPAFQTAILESVDGGMEAYYSAALRQLADELDKVAGSASPDGKYSQYGVPDLGTKKSVQPPVPDATESNEDRNSKK